MPIQLSSGVVLNFLRKRRTKYEIELADGLTSWRVYKDSYLRTVAEEIVCAAELACLKSRGVSGHQAVLEIGSAGGIIKRIRPDWSTSDIRPSSGVDFVFSGEKMEVPDESLDMIFAQDVLHHIENLERFMDEAGRILLPGGIVFCKEPYWGLLAQIVFRFFHPELFSKKKVSIKSSFEGPMGGNQALAWTIVTESGPMTPIYLMEKGFELVKIGPVLGLAFLLSGGTTLTTSLPRSALLKLHRIESENPWWLRFCGFGYLFYLRKV